MHRLLLFIPGGRLPWDRQSDRPVRPVKDHASNDGNESNQAYDDEWKKTSQILSFTVKVE